jgi:hypothetical protein
MDYNWTLQMDNKIISLGLAACSITPSPAWLRPANPSPSASFASIRRFSLFDAYQNSSNNVDVHLISMVRYTPGCVANVNNSQTVWSLSISIGDSEIGVLNASQLPSFHSRRYSWVKNSLLCEIFVVEGKMIMGISVNFRSFHSENTIGLSGQERSL